MTGPAKLTRPTFNELSVVLQKIGASNALCEDGSIRLGGLVFISNGVTPDFARAARVAQVIDDLAVRQPGDSFYDEDNTILFARACDGIVHLIERTQGSAPREVLLPHKSLAAVSATLIDCMGEIRNQAPAPMEQLPVDSCN